MADREVFQLGFQRFGPPNEVLEMRTTRLSEDLGPDQALVEMLAAPINPADLNYIEGRYGVRPILPAVAGLEGVGRVVKSRWPGVEEGRLVLLPPFAGTWADSVLCSADSLIRLPRDHQSDLLQLAMLRVNPATAFLMLKTVPDLKPGDWVVQNAGNSGVGISTFQIAKAMGYNVASVVRTEAAVEAMRGLGVAVVAIDCDEGWASLQHHWGSEPPRLALNAVGGESASRLVERLGPSGVLLTYGAMARRPVTLSNRQLIFEQIVSQGFWLTKVLEKMPLEEQEALYAQLAKMVSDGALRLPVQQRFLLEEYQNALEQVPTPGRFGKVLFVRKFAL